MKALTLLLVLLPTLGYAGEVECLSHIIYSEAQGEPLTGQIAVGNASINRAKDTNTPICKIKGVTRKKPPLKVHAHYLAVARSAMDNPSIVSKADSWDRSKKPKYAGKIVARIGQHTFYVMKGLS